MNRALAVLLCCFGLTASAVAGDPDTQVDRYLSIWADNARVTPAAVQRLYASRVVYYGKPMTGAQVYRDKANYIRQWPDRRYSVVPGSVNKTCNPDQSACTLFAVLSWERSDPATHAGSKGANTLTLRLVRQDGVLKIARESGSPLAQSACRGTGRGWACSGYR